LVLTPVARVVSGSAALVEVRLPLEIRRETFPHHGVIDAQALLWRPESQCVCIRAAGCDGYIAKPMRYKEFLATVSDQLNIT
jgi:hypothetical protein